MAYFLGVERNRRMSFWLIKSTGLSYEEKLLERSGRVTMIKGLVLSMAMGIVRVVDNCQTCDVVLGQLR